MYVKCIEIFGTKRKIENIVCAMNNIYPDARSLMDILPHKNLVVN